MVALEIDTPLDVTAPLYCKSTPPPRILVQFVSLLVAPSENGDPVTAPSYRYDNAPPYPPVWQLLNVDAWMLTPDDMQLLA